MSSSVSQIRALMSALKKEVAEHGNLQNAANALAALERAELDIKELCLDLEAIASSRSGGLTLTAEERAESDELAKLRPGKSIPREHLAEALRLARATDAARDAFWHPSRAAAEKRETAIAKAVARLESIPFKGRKALDEINAHPEAKNGDLLRTLRYEAEDREDGFKHVSEGSWSILKIVLDQLNKEVSHIPAAAQDAKNAAEAAEEAFFKAHASRKIITVPLSVRTREEDSQVDTSFGAYCKGD